MSISNKIKGIVKGMPNDMGMILAKVTSISPIALISLSNSKRVMTGNSLIIPEGFNKFELDTTIQYDGGLPQHAKITVNNELKVGDIVHVMAFDEEQRFIVVSKSAGEK